VADPYEEVVGIHQTSFGRRIEQVVRISGDVLVERRRRCHENSQRRLVAPAGATDLLPGARQRARVAGEDGGIESADIDAELERVRSDDATDAALAQAALDRTTFIRQIAAAIALDGGAVVGTDGAAGLSARVLAKMTQQQFDADARWGEDDGLDAGAQKAAGD
jgi:hypothetical protein